MRKGEEAGGPPAEGILEERADDCYIAQREPGGGGGEPVGSHNRNQQYSQV